MRQATAAPVQPWEGGYRGSWPNPPFAMLLETFPSPHKKRQGAAPHSGGGCERPSREQSPAQLSTLWHHASPSSCAVTATLVPPHSPTPCRGAKALRHTRACLCSPGRAARWQSGSACPKLNEEKR